MLLRRANCISCWSIVNFGSSKTLLPLTGICRHSQLCQRSASTSLLKVSTDSSTDISILRLNRPSTNLLNKELLTDLNNALEKLDNDRSCRGVVITSDVPDVFSAGLDISEMYQANKDSLAELWRLHQSLWISLYGSHLVTVAAINGDSLAAGCLIALSCDYRVMAAGNYAVGLNAIQLGMVAPSWYIASLKQVIGHRRCEQALQLGQTFNPAEALSVGLVDEVIEDGSLLVQHAIREIQLCVQVPDAGRELTKNELRRPTVEHLLARRDQDTNSFVSLASKKSIQRMFAKHLESSKK